MADANTRLFQYLFGFSHASSLVDAAVAFTAAYAPFLILLISILFAVSRKEWRTRTLLFIEITLAVLIARGLIVESIKFFYSHPRPSSILDIEALVNASGNSFPSGHAAFFFALATVIFFWNRTIGLWCAAIAALNALARVVAGAHWPLDIAGGVIAGIASALAARALLAPVRRALESNEKTEKVLGDISEVV